MRKGLSANDKGADIFVDMLAWPGSALLVRFPYNGKTAETEMLVCRCLWMTNNWKLAKFTSGNKIIPMMHDCRIPQSKCALHGIQSTAARVLEQILISHLMFN